MNIKYALRLKRELVALLAKIRLKNVSSNYLGYDLKVPIVHGIANGGYIVPKELWMGECLKAFIDTKEGAVIDIGVNVGLYLVKLRVYSLDREYIGFEPSASCNLYTQELIRLNHINNARVFSLALSDGEYVTKFYTSKPGDKTGSLISESKKGKQLDYSFDVMTMTGDSALARINTEKISVIKVDVEEAEVYVLRGLVRTIEKCRPYVYCEILATHDESKKLKNAAEIVALMRSYDYEILGVTIDDNTLEKISDFSEVGKNYQTEYIFCPAELLTVFSNAVNNNSVGVMVLVE